MKVFVGSGWLPQEQKLAEKVIDIFKGYREIELEEAKLPEINGRLKKIRGVIDWADVSIFVLSKRYEASAPAEERSGIWLPSTYVITEAGFALGRYFDYLHRKRVHVFYEKGISEEDLGMLRDTELDHTQILLSDREIDKKIKYVAEGFIKKFSKPPSAYRQQSVKKDFVIFKEGNVRVRNTVTIVVENAKDFQTVPHCLMCTKKIPRIEDLQKKPISDQASLPFFRAGLRSFNTKIVKEAPINAREERRVGNDTYIVLEFPSGGPADFRGYKDGDVIEYEYEWGMPKVFLPLPQKKENEYAIFRTPYGEVNNATVTLCFQKAYKLSKQPFFKLAPRDTTDNPHFQPTTYQFSYYDAIWGHMYYDEETNFYGTLKAEWRPLPKSKKA